MKAGIKVLSDASAMTVRSDAGTDLSIDITDTRGAGFGVIATVLGKSPTGRAGWCCVSRKRARLMARW